tara:strand:+ start:57 stop:245 length:189 start_codon:yes stop_codon:yes gene_type:complete
VIEKVFFGLASVLVFEGLILAIMPTRIKAVIKLIERIPSSSLSISGLVMMVVGIVFLSMIEL